MKTAGRVVYGLPFVIFGIMHLAFGSKMAGMVPAWVPGGVVWVYLTGIALIVGGTTIVANKMGRMGALLIAALMILFILTVHIPGLMNESTQQMAMGGFFKDMALCGGALTLASILK